VIGEDAERRLVEHLVSHVTNGLSGRDGADLVDQIPVRTLFAGVLQPARETDKTNAARGTAGDAPGGTSLGLDLRLRPAPQSQEVTVLISARFAVYYPVFPSYPQAVGANTGSKGPDAKEETDQGEEPVDDPAETEGVAVDEIIQSPGPLASTTTPAPAPDETPAPTISDGERGRVILPRVWRRYEVIIPAQTVTLATSTKTFQTIGDDAIAAAVDAARASVQGDPARWVHLGPIESRERALGDSAVLGSPRSYEAALAGKRGMPVEPPPWNARIEVASEPDPSVAGLLRIRALLVNGTPDGYMAKVDAGLEERSLFDSGIQIEAKGADVVPFDFLLAPKDYRANPQMPAKGINCIAESIGLNALATETLPVYRQPYYRTRDSLQVDFDTLSGPTALVELGRIGREMDSYVGSWDAFLKTEATIRFSPEEVAACTSDRNGFADEVAAFRLGLEVLQRDSRLLDAFQLMNQAFARLAKRSGGRVKAWRLFQIGFICSQLACLAVRELPKDSQDEYAVKLKESLDEVGILWFPTGGGKTEAYLGLISVALLFDRLRGKTRGVTAWMRFPLRMLSLQQLDRLARVIAILDELRSEVPRLCVGDPFAIGYYVGDTNTPNRVDEATMHAYQTNLSLRESVRLIRQCPFCDQRVEIRTDITSWRLAHVCTNSTCFSNTSASLGRARGSLPIYVVDNEIYRYLPSVLVGTVDKLAIAGSNRNFAHLMRGVTQECPEHGYSSLDECIERWDASCKRSKSKLTKLNPIKDPGPALLIQDEFHLLRAELGVFNGHYEGLIRYLGARAYLPPKILAATATIEAYDVQAFHIYLCRARRYPQPSWEQGESFYATSKPLLHRRFYLGVLSHVRGIEEPAIRALSLYLSEVRRLQANPSIAASQMAIKADDGEIQSILRLHDLSVCYVNRKATGGSLVEKLGRLEGSFQAAGLGPLSAELLTGDQTIDDVGAVIDRIEREIADTGAARLDVVVATSLISHGVDLERINMMTVCGMPSHYAEYVQASSRCGRSHPGIVLACFNGRDPRERSQYEFFTTMHEHMERLIEAVAVNRFASYAASKTVPGLLVGLLLSALTPELFGSQIAKPLDNVPTLQVALGMKPGPNGPSIEIDSLRDAILEIIGVDVVRPPASPAQVANAKSRAISAFDDVIGLIGRTMETRVQEVVHPLTSFRDVDEGIEFGSIDSAGIVAKMRAR
jgi:Helicase conserved C-terminal domain